MDIFAKCDGDGGNFGPFRARGDHYFSRPIIDALPGNRMEFQGKECVMWSINNYLGLAGNKEVDNKESLLLSLYCSRLRATLPLATLIIAPDSTFMTILSSLTLSITP